MDNMIKPVWLSDLNFVTSPPAGNSTSHLDPNQVRTTSDSAASGYGVAKPVERLTTQKIGEELAPDAAIWQLYLDEAKEHDEELIKGQNENLDNMLLFAGLFSAILSAFLIESKNLLQNDSTDISVALLLAIAQSQQRIEKGTPQLSSASIELPVFTVPLSARWINGLWFFALALSLSAALIAMLAKEWLTAFTTSRPRSAHAFALVHQARLAGLIKWHAQGIIDLLPSLLHVALLLFSLGLVLYLWTLDSGITFVMVLVTGVTFGCYVITALLGAIYEHCPFVTHISKSIPKSFVTCIQGWVIEKTNGGVSDKHLSYTTDEELRALTWLAEHARDPDVVDHTYMSLAGLRLQSSESFIRGAAKDDQSFSTTTATAISGTTPGGDVSITMRNTSCDSIQQYTPIPSLFNSLCTRLSQAVTHSPREVSARQGSDVARYALALPHMVQYFLVYSKQNNIGKASDKKHAGQRPTQAAFDALDTIWDSNFPALSSDSYALLTSSELLLTVAAASSSISVLPQGSTAEVVEPESLSPIGTASHANGSLAKRVGIDMDRVEETLPETLVSLSDLQARYSRALTRVGVLLHYHANGHAPISSSPLIHLLNSVRASAQCSQLNPDSHLSTDQPQSNLGRSPVVFIQVVGFRRFSLEPNTVGARCGLLIGLLRLLSPAGVQTPPTLESAATSALCVIAPILLGQWLGVVTSHDPREESEDVELSGAILTNGSLLNDYKNDLGPVFLAQQLMRIVIFVSSHAECSGIEELPEQAMLALYRQVQAVASYHRMLCILGSDAGHNRLIRVVDSNSGKLPQNVFKSLIRIFLLKGDQDEILLKNPGISAQSISPFLRILSRVSVQISELQTILTSVIDYTCSSDWILGHFMRSEGFSGLLWIGEQDKHPTMVAKYITQIIQRAAELSVGSTPEEQAILGAFNAVNFALKAVASDKEETLNLLASARNYLTRLLDLPHDVLRSIATSASTTNLSVTLQNMDELSEERANLLMELEGLDGWLHAYGLPAEGLGPFFEQGAGAENGSSDILFSSYD